MPKKINVLQKWKNSLSKCDFRNCLLRKPSAMLQVDKTVVYVYSQWMEFCSDVGLSHERVMQGAKLQEQVQERFVWS
jgi:hypothetical protein